MNDRMEIGIIDSGIDEKVIEKGRMDKEYFFTLDNLLEHNNTNKNIKELKHGTICALVIEKYCSNCCFLSIRLLNSNGRGTVDRIESSFDACIKNDVKLVNISLGTTCFQDKNKIRRAINHYSNKGLILIAATSNDGKTTYPASFSNVIGVTVGEGVKVDKNIQLQKGIDFTAPSDHEIAINGVSFRLGNSNSYAAPYVTAIVANLINEKGTMTIDEIRGHLCGNGSKFIYAPDWIESAWITPDYRKSDADFYFNVEHRSLQECMDDIDTIVVSNDKEIDKYVDAGKHIVYVGNDRISRFDNKHHFWSRELRHEQIMSSKERTGEVDIPSIRCIFDNQVDIIWCLCALKELFENEGYNAFVGCNLVDSVLYDLEYLPDGDTIQEKLADFVYWQTYYQQTDIILVGTTDKKNDVNIVDKSDMILYFNLEKNGITVKMFSDGESRAVKKYTKLDIGSITKIYSDIIGSFEKEDE